MKWDPDRVTGQGFTLKEQSEARCPQAAPRLSAGEAESLAVGILSSLLHTES